MKSKAGKILTPTVRLQKADIDAARSLRGSVNYNVVWMDYVLPLVRNEIETELTRLEASKSLHLPEIAIDENLPYTNNLRQIFANTNELLLPEAIERLYWGQVGKTFPWLLQKGATDVRKNDLKKLGLSVIRRGVGTLSGNGLLEINLQLQRPPAPRTLRALGRYLRHAQVYLVKNKFPVHIKLLANGEAATVIKKEYTCSNLVPSSALSPFFLKIRIDLEVTVVKLNSDWTSGGLSSSQVVWPEYFDFLRNIKVLAIDRVGDYLRAISFPANILSVRELNHLYKCYTPIDGAYLHRIAEGITSLRLDFEISNMFLKIEGLIKIPTYYPKNIIWPESDEKKIQDIKLSDYTKTPLSLIFLQRPFMKMLKTLSRLCGPVNLKTILPEEIFAE